MPPGLVAGPRATTGPGAMTGPRTVTSLGGVTGPRGRDGSAGRDWAGTATIPQLAARSAQRVPHRVAVSVDGQPVTHGQLDAEARQVAGWLAGRLDRGERMLLAAGTSLGFLRWYLGALRAGVVVVLANPGYTAAELGHLIADSGSRLAVADPVPAQRLAAWIPAWIWLGWKGRPGWGRPRWSRERGWRPGRAGVGRAADCRPRTGLRKLHRVRRVRSRPWTTWRCSPTPLAPPGAPRVCR